MLFHRTARIIVIVEDEGFRPIAPSSIVGLVSHQGRSEKTDLPWYSLKGDRTRIGGVNDVWWRVTDCQKLF